jgi:hypothetical protein
MKLSNVTAKLTSIKSSALKVLAVTALAGAALTAATPAAQAQRVVVGVGFGGPRYIAPPVAVYGGPVFYGGYGYRHDDWRFHDRARFDRGHFDHDHGGRR